MERLLIVPQTSAAHRLCRRSALPSFVIDYLKSSYMSIDKINICGNWVVRATQNPVWSAGLSHYNIYLEKMMKKNHPTTRLSRITGLSYCPIKDKDTWHNNHKLLKAERLSRMFGFQLGTPEALDHIQKAIATLEHMYHVEKMTPKEFVERFDWHTKYFGTFLESLGIKRRTRKEGVINYMRSIGKLITDDKMVYYKQCRFQFDVYQHPNIIGFNLLKEHDWYHSQHNKNGLVRDHMVSVSYGWYNNIDPSIISNPANCQIMLATDNIKKNDGISLTVEDLLARIRNWEEDPNSIVPRIYTKRKRSPLKDSTKEKLAQTNLGKISVTDGEKNIWIKENDPIPDGFKKGMTMRARANARLYQIDWETVQKDIDAGFGFKQVCVRNGIKRDEYYGGLKRSLITKHRDLSTIIPNT